MFKKNLLFIIIALTFLTACSQDSLSSENNNQEPQSLVASKVEVIYFHSTQRCVACITMDEFTKGTIYEFFQSELRDGLIEFKEINVDLPENRELVNKFQARGSGLYINAIYDDNNIITEEIQVWRLLNNEAQFKNYLRNKLNNLLGK